MLKIISFTRIISRSHYLFVSEIGQNMKKAALYKKHIATAPPQAEMSQQKDYSRKAFNNLQKMHAQTVNFGRIMTILQKFTARHGVEVAVMSVIIILTKMLFIGLMALPVTEDALVSPFFSSVGGAFISNFVAAFVGLSLSKKLLLSPDERRNAPAFQGAMRYIVFASVMSSISLMIGFALQVMFVTESAMLSSLLTLVGTLLAASVTAMVIVQYGLVLPAAASGRKHSMEIACQQVRPFWKTLFGMVFSCKAVMVVLSFLFSAISLPVFVSASILAVLSSLFTVYIYLALSASYAAAGYLFNTDFDVHKDDFVR